MSQQTPPPINPDSKPTAKVFVASLSKSAGAAAKLVGLQAERSKLTTLTLPAAYRALGRDCVQQKRHLDGVKELIEQLRTVISELSSLVEAPQADSSKQSLTDKAKAAGKQAVDLARRKQLEMKRESLCGDVGKVIYETYKESSGSKDLVTPIQAALQRVTELDSEIAKLSEVGKGSWITPKRIMFFSAVMIATFVIGPLFSEKSTTQSEVTDKQSSTTTTKAMTDNGDYERGFTEGKDKGNYYMQAYHKLINEEQREDFRETIQERLQTMENIYDLQSNYGSRATAEYARGELEGFRKAIEESGVR